MGRSVFFGRRPGRIFLTSLSRRIEDHTGSARRGRDHKERQQGLALPSHSDLLRREIRSNLQRFLDLVQSTYCQVRLIRRPRHPLRGHEPDGSKALQALARVPIPRKPRTSPCPPHLATKTGEKVGLGSEMRAGFEDREFIRRQEDRESTLSIEIFRSSSSCERSFGHRSIRESAGRGRLGLEVNCS